MADNPFAKWGTPKPPTPPAAPPNPGGGLADFSRAQVLVDEVGASWDRLAKDWRTTLTPEKDEQRTPLPKNASLIDHAMALLSGGTSRAPGGEHAAAADRAAGSDLVDLPMSAVRGVIRGVGGSGVSEEDAQVYAAAGLAAAPMVGPAARGAGRVGAAALRRPIGAVREVGSRVRAGMGHEPGAPPTPEMRAKAQGVGTEHVARMAKRLDPTGEKLGANPLEARGKPITGAEALGRPAESALGATGRRTGQTPDALESQLRARHAETGQRITDDFGQLSGLDPEAVEGDFQTQMEGLRAKAGPLYEHAYNSGPVESPVLTSLLQRPSMKAALAKATKLAQEEGRNPVDIGLETRPVTHDTGLKNSKGEPITFTTEEQVEVRNPTMQTWDYVKRGLDAVLDDARDPVTLKLKPGTETRAITRTLGELRDELTRDDSTWGPGYRAALDAGGEPLRMEEAFGSAKQLASPSVSESDFNRRIGKYGPSQMEALKAGLVNQVRTAARAGRQRLGEMDTPAFRAKLTRVFGHDVAEQMALRISDERFLMAHGSRMTPGTNSITAETLMADQETQEATRELRRVVGHAAKGDWGKAILHVVMSPIEGAYRGAQMPMDEATRDVIGALLSKKPSELAKALQEHGATATQAAHATAVMARSGLFTPHAAAILSVMASQMGHPGTQAPAQASPDANPFAKFKPASKGGDFHWPDEQTTPKSETAPDGPPGPKTTNAQAASYLQDHLGVPVKITSHWRTPERNDEVGGARNSAHLRGEAWDFVPQGLSMEDAGQQLAQSGILFDQIEITPTHVHVSFDPQMRGEVVYVGYRQPQAPEEQDAPPIDAGAEDLSAIQ